MLSTVPETELLQVVPSLTLDCANVPVYFLGFQVLVSGSVNPKYDASSCCPSMK